MKKRKNKNWFNLKKKRNMTCYGMGKGKGERDWIKICTYKSIIKQLICLKILTVRSRQLMVV